MAKKEDKTRFPEPDLPRALDLLMKLLALKGPSGKEGPVAAFVIHQLARGGAPASAIKTDSAHRRTSSPGETGNLVLKLPGTFRGPRRMLMAHLDTVPLCVGSRPVRKGNTIRCANKNAGLGADDRTGVAVLLTVALEILRRKLPHPPLTFFWSVQEEVGLQGSRYASVGLLGKPKLAFNWDGGAPEKLTVGATGGYRMTIEVTGKASHAGGAPEEGVSAVAIAALAIADLQRNGWHGDIRKPEGDGTSNVGSIHGGEATNVVTDRVVLTAEARSHVPTFRKRIVREIEKSFRSAAREVRSVHGAGGKVTFDGRLDYESFLLPHDEPCVTVAEEAVRSISLSPQRAVANGGLDANWMVRHRIPTVSLGCGARGQHTLAESVNVRYFEQACRIALRLATSKNPGFRLLSSHSR